MKARLLYRDAQGRDSAADLVASGSFVGRAQECVVRTDDAMVSRRNCKIWREGKQWWVEDLVSSNGTFVNDARVQKQALRHADIIRCGTLQARFVEIDNLPSDRVSVDPSLLEATELDSVKKELESVLKDRSEKEQKLFEVLRELDTLKIKSETDTSELQRLRADVVAQRDKLSEIGRIRQLTDEELNAQVRVGEQLRRDLDALKKDHVELRDKHDKTSGDLQARERQLERSLEDVQRTKQTLDEVRGRLGELERTKDAGWRELNSRAGELDGLRAVISEQERLLEERRVGLIALESSAQELRGEKERLLRELVIMRTERDDSKAQLQQVRTNLEGLDEEHRRLQRRFAEGGGGNVEDAIKLAGELRQARVAQKTLEAERERLNERVERADQARAEMEQKLASLDVERTHALEERQRAISAKERAEESFARSELQRKASDDTRRAVEATDAKMAAEVTALKNELEAARAEIKTQAGVMAETTRALERARDATVTEIAARKKAEAALAEKPARQSHQTMQTSEELVAMGDPSTSPITLDMSSDQEDETSISAANRIHALEEELALLGSELAVARAELEGRKQDGEAGELRRRAQSAYDSVNDALSHLRTNILLAKRLVGELGADSDTARSLGAAIAASIDSAEDAKGVLRGLREVVEA